MSLKWIYIFFESVAFIIILIVSLHEHAFLFREKWDKHVHKLLRKVCVSLLNISAAHFSHIPNYYPIYSTQRKNCFNYYSLESRHQIYIWNRKTEHFNGMLSFNASSKINYGLVIVIFSPTMLLEYFYCTGKVGAWITAGAWFSKLKEPLEHRKLCGIISLKGRCSVSGFHSCLKYVAS